MNALEPAMERMARDALYRSSLFAFTWKVFDALHRGNKDKFIANWHVQAMCHELEELLAGRNLRLVITVPPRHLKSITTAVAFPALLLGHDPGRKVIVASYGLDLARKHSKDFRKIVESQWYCDLFPKTRIAENGSRQDEIITTAGGGRKAVSIGGSVTGFGADYLIVDDLLKAGDAGSEVELERAKNYLESSLLSRFDDPRTGRVVAIQQRLHEDDPAGYLLGTGDYRHLNLPAIAEEDTEIAIGRGKMYQREKGAALFPQRMDLEVLARRRREMGSANFNCQYQQNPTAFDGSALRWEWFGSYDGLEGRSWYQMVIQSWDTGMSADPRSDYSVCTTWGFREGKWYLLDLFRDRLDYPDLKKEVFRLGRKWNADTVLIEKAATGILLLQECRLREPYRFQSVQPLQNKQVRFNASCAAVEEGKIVLPREAQWLFGFKKELLGFPRSRYDDQVDSFSQFVNWSQGTGFHRKLPRDSPYRPLHPRRDRIRC